MIDKGKELFNKHNVVLYQGVRLYKADFFDYVNKYEYSRPYIIKINNDIIYVNTWANAVVETIDYIDKLKKDFYFNCSTFEVPWTKRQFFSNNEKHKFISPKISRSGIYVETNTDSLHLLWLIRELLKYAEIDLDKVEVLYKRKACDEPQEIQNFVKEDLYFKFKKWLMNFKGKSEKYADAKIDYFSKIDNIFFKVSSARVPLVLMDSKTELLKHSKKFINYIDLRYADRLDIRKSVNIILKLYLQFFSCITSRNAPDLTEDCILISKPSDRDVFKMTKIVSFKINGQEIFVDSWHSMIAKSVEYFIQVNLNNLSKLKELCDFDGQKLLSKTKKDFIKPTKLSIDYYLNVNFGPEQAVKIVDKICEECGASLGDIKHFVKTKYNAESTYLNFISLKDGIVYYEKKDFNFIYTKFSSYSRSTLEDALNNDENIDFNFIEEKYNKFVDICKSNGYFKMSQLLFLPFESVEITSVLEKDIISDALNKISLWIDLLDDDYDAEDMFSDEEIKKFITGKL